VTIDDELAKEMSKYPTVNWTEAVRTLLKECLHRKEIAEMYNAPVERMTLQEE
jgi:hypothetical protein